MASSSSGPPAPAAAQAQAALDGLKVEFLNHSRHHATTMAQLNAQWDAVQTTYDGEQRALDLLPRQRNPFTIWVYLQLDGALASVIDSVYESRHAQDWTAITSKDPEIAGLMKSMRKSLSLSTWVLWFLLGPAIVKSRTTIRHLSKHLREQINLGPSPATVLVDALRAIEVEATIRQDLSASGSAQPPRYKPADVTKALRHLSPPSPPSPASPASPASPPQADTHERDGHDSDPSPPSPETGRRQPPPQTQVPSGVMDGADEHSILGEHASWKDGPNTESASESKVHGGAEEGLPSCNSIRASSSPDRCHPLGEGIQITGRRKRKWQFDELESGGAEHIQHPSLPSSHEDEEDEVDEDGFAISGLLDQDDHDETGGIQDAADLHLANSHPKTISTASTIGSAAVTRNASGSPVPALASTCSTSRTSTDFGHEALVHHPAASGIDPAAAPSVTKRRRVTDPAPAPAPAPDPGFSAHPSAESNLPSLGREGGGTTVMNNPPDATKQPIQILPVSLPSPCRLASDLRACESLSPMTWLNDDAVNKSIRQVIAASSVDGKQVGFLDSWQCHRILGSGGGDLSPKVRRQARPYLLMAVHTPGHWILFSWHEATAMLRRYDSLRQPDSSQQMEMRTALLGFLTQLYQLDSPLAEQRDFIEADCEQQTNLYDCGLFAVANAQATLQDMTGHAHSTAAMPRCEQYEPSSPHLRSALAARLLSGPFQVPLSIFDLVRDGAPSSGMLLRESIVVGTFTASAMQHNYKQWADAKYGLTNLANALRRLHNGRRRLVEELCAAAQDLQPALRARSEQRAMAMRKDALEAFLAKVRAADAVEQDGGGRDAGILELGRGQALPSGASASAPSASAPRASVVDLIHGIGGLAQTALSMVQHLVGQQEEDSVEACQERVDFVSAQLRLSSYLVLRTAALFRRAERRLAELEGLALAYAH